MNPTFTKVLAGLVLFVSGAVMGFFGARLLSERGTLALLHGDSHRFVDMALHRMSRDLDLTEEQRKKLRPIVLDTAKKLADLRREQEPKIHEIIKKSIEATKPLLTPEQLEKFEAIQARLKQRRQAMDRFGPPPPPPGFGPPPPPPGMGPPPELDGFPPPPGMGPPPEFGPDMGPDGPHHFGGHRPHDRREPPDFLRDDAPKNKAPSDQDKNEPPSAPDTTAPGEKKDSKKSPNDSETGQQSRLGRFTGPQSLAG